jgi:putative PIN family toxin of toxin-antitoxin system
MRLIVLDSNVLVSARINSQGVPSKIANLALEGEIQVVTCPCITAEYIAVASRAKFHAYGFPPIWLGTLIQNSLALSDPEPLPCPCPDPKDTPFLALARAAGAWLVTGNLRHFPEHIRGEVIVVSAAEYLARLAG